MFLLKRIFILNFITLALCNEIAYKDIPLSGPILNPKQEISGLDWYGDHLVLLPENLGGFLYMIQKNKIISTINQKSPKPITPQQPNFITPDWSQTIDGFEGLEAIAFNDNNVYITLEVKNGDTMESYLAWGRINPKTKDVIIPEKNLLQMNTPKQIKNMTFESILVQDSNVIIFYEANGANLFQSPWQYLISLKDFSQSKIYQPNIEYRITDVTRLNHENKFWAINYHWPGDTKRLKPTTDSIVVKFGEGETHKKSDAVERLIEFEIRNDQIRLSNRSPIQLSLDKENSRNWEGIVRLDNKGFLIATDKYPRMILGYVPFE